MMTAARIAVALVLVSLPSRQAAAQTSAEAFSRAEVSQISEEGSRADTAALVPIPVSTRLWQPVTITPVDALERRPTDPAPVPGWDEWSTDKKIWVVGGIVVGLMVLGVVSIG